MFKRKGNEAQALFNAKVDEALAQADSDIADIASGPVESPAIRRARDSIQKGRAIIEERQKLIRLADRSEHGWMMVDKYTADDLADGSEDEKKIEKAERAAERKVGKRRKKRTAEAAAGKPRGVPARFATVAGPPAAGHASFTQPPHLGHPYRRQPVPPGGRPVGPCHFCGEMGHLRLYCPTRASVEGKKWYPFPSKKCSDEVVHGSEASCKSVNCGTEANKALSRDGVKASNSINDAVDCFVQFDQSKGKLSTQSCVSQVSIGEDATQQMLCTPQKGAQFWELGAEDLAGAVPVKGRLRKCLEFWRDVLHAPPAVLKVIESGYVLPLMSEPTQFCGNNQASALGNADFVRECIAELVSSGCVKEVEDMPFVCSPLSVVENSMGKKRLVVNLRHINKFLYKQKFKYEDLRVAMMLFKKGDYMFSFDLKSGYHNIDIDPAHHKYLGFAWEGRFFTFTVLPFGLCTACYLFTKVVRPLVRYWRAQGIRVVVYLDDGLGAAAGAEAATRDSQMVRNTLERAGFVVHPVKSIWNSVQHLIWLGLEVDLEAGQIRVPEHKLAALKNMLEQVRKSSRVSARVLTSLLGKIISMGLAFGPVSRFMTRSLYVVLESRQSWSELLRLSSEASEELAFWSSSMEQYNAQPIWHSPSAVRVVYSDASDTGFGGYVVEHGGCVTHGQWTAAEAIQSSTWRELSAVYLVLLSVANKLVNARVRWFTDNQNVVWILQVGSKKPHLQKIALKVLSLAIQFQIRLEPEWVPRELNEKADFLSRIIDYDDWFLNPSVFAWLDSMWGPHTVDRFADWNNCQLPRFNSRCWNPGSEAVDAFTADWRGENNWWCPPVSLVPRVIAHAQACRAEGTLIVPEWKSAPFWPLLQPVEGKFSQFVVAVKELPLSELLFVPGLSGSSLFGGSVPNTNVLAVRCDFTKPE